MVVKIQGVYFRASLLAEQERICLPMQETQVHSLGWEDPLEKGMATHSSQYSCLGNPMDRGAWWATIHGSQSQTRLRD